MPKAATPLGVNAVWRENALRKEEQILAYSSGGWHVLRESLGFRFWNP